MVITGSKTFLLLIQLEHYTAALQGKVALCTLEESEASCFQHEGHFGDLFGCKSTVTI
jgi:hypothetical protein